MVRVAKVENRSSGGQAEETTFYLFILAFGLGSYGGLLVHGWGDQG
jgi:hypothetical protein